MTQPFFARLKNYYSSVGQVLRGEAATASIFPNATDIGMSRERVYAEVLRSHIPASCNVFFGGFLFDQAGNESRQIDILVTDESALQFNFQNRAGGGKAFACIDGCLAVVSVKSTLDSAQLVDSLHNLASLPDKQPLAGRVLPNIEFSGYDDWPFKIVYASNGISVASARAALTAYYEAHPDIPVAKRPNLIHVAGQYVIVRVGEEGSRTPDGIAIAAGTFVVMRASDDVYGLLHAALQIQRIATASKHILYDYGTLLSNIPFQDSSTPVRGHSNA